jgi:predicted O-methyltransferase YrrM
MTSILQSLGIQEYKLTGVDRFENAYGDDWPEELRGKTWQEAGFGEPPDLAAAQSNLGALKVLSNVRLEQDRAEHFLDTTPEKFDFIYIDTAHDYDSTIRLIALAVRRLTPNGWIGGDDFSDRGTWGVATAVRDSFANFQVFSNWLWLAREQDFKPKPVSVA